MTHESLIEAVARAICEQDDANYYKRNPEGAIIEPYDEFPEHWKEDYRSIAKAALKARADWLENQELLSPTLQQANKVVSDLPDNIKHNAHFEGQNHDD